MAPSTVFAWKAKFRASELWPTGYSLLCAVYKLRIVIILPKDWGRGGDETKTISWHMKMI